jgi:hypothetical protein
VPHIARSAPVLPRALTAQNTGPGSVPYRLGVSPATQSVMIEIDEVELLPFSSITEEDLARTGEPDLETLRRRAAHAGPIHDGTVLYRVEFHVVRPQGDALT